VTILFQVVVIRTHAEPNYEGEYLGVIILEAAFIVLSVILYFAQKKSQLIQRYLNPVYCLIILVSRIEGSMFNNKAAKSPDEMLIACALIATLSTVSHSLMDLISAFGLGIVYSVIRAYFIFGESEVHHQYVKFIFSLILSLGLIVTFSREVHSFQRRNFVQQ
jgi:hypothetical protein